MGPHVLKKISISKQRPVVASDSAGVDPAEVFKKLFEKLNPCKYREMLQGRILKKDIERLCKTKANANAVIDELLKLPFSHYVHPAKKQISKQRPVVASAGADHSATHKEKRVKQISQEDYDK